MSLSPGQGHYVLFSGKAPLSLLMYLANCQVTRVVGGGGGGALHCRSSAGRSQEVTKHRVRIHISVS